MNMLAKMTKKQLLAQVKYLESEISDMENARADACMEMENEHNDALDSRYGEIDDLNREISDLANKYKLATIAALVTLAFLIGVLCLVAAYV
jgi:polyhydroxyalkanoate synthesis regulator phasin